MKTVFFSFIIVMIIAISGWFQFQQVQQLRQDTQNSLIQLSNQVQSQKKESEEALTAALSKKSPPPLMNDKMGFMAEIDYLVRMATIQLQIAHDVKSAKILLVTAKEKIQSLNDPATIPLNQALMQDINALNAVQQPNIEEIWLHLSDLIKKVPNLSLPKAPSIVSPDSPKESTLTDSSWKQALIQSFSDIKNLIKIRKHEKPIETIFSPIELFLGRELLSLKLEEIRFSVLNPRQTIYQQLISETQECLKKFEQNDDNVKQMQQTLSDLYSIELQPELPTLTKTLEQIHKLRQ